jgi:DNA-binding GntR family transcriptional regulator
MRKKKLVVPEGVTKFKALYDILAQKVVRYSNGERLPSENELVAEYGVSRTTVRRAFGMLIREKKIKPVRGSGTYVRRSQS